MRRALAILAALLPLPVLAQGQAPQLSVEFAQDETLPGQPLVLRMTVLVPTFLPEPPVWPAFDAPDLRVRLPARATNPVSGRVGGATWSGVSRRWQVTPLAPGAFALPPARIEVTWADPEAPGGPPLRAVLDTPALPFRAVVPEGAEDLSPFLAASDLTLERAVEGEPQGMAPGEALSVTLTARIAGASPMLLPPLGAAVEIPGLAAYPDDPELVETEDRGRLGGARTERLSLLAQGGGAGELPAIALRWWDLDEGRIRTAEVPALAISVDGPPARAAAPDPAARLRLALLAGAGLAAALALAWLARRAAPGLRARLAERRAARRASEAHAWAGLRAALRARDGAALRPALDLWAGRVAGDPRAEPSVQAALLALGAARYAPGATGEAASAWRRLSAALAAARRAHPPRGRGAAREDVRRLPPLNPA